MSKSLCLYIQEGYGTPADKNENQVPEEIKHTRFNKLKELVETQIEGNNAKYLGTTQKVLVEGRSKTDKTKLTRKNRN